MYKYHNYKPGIYESIYDSILSALRRLTGGGVGKEIKTGIIL